MKKLIFILLIIIAAIIMYQKESFMYNTNNTGKSDPTIEVVSGKVSSKLYILGQSAYKLVDHHDTTLVYYVIGHQAPAVGQSLTVSVQKQELVILNNDTLAVYMEVDKPN